MPFELVPTIFTEWKDGLKHIDTTRHFACRQDLAALIILSLHGIGTRGLLVGGTCKCLISCSTPHPVPVRAVRGNTYGGAWLFMESLQDIDLFATLAADEDEALGTNSHTVFHYFQSM